MVQEIKPYNTFSILVGIASAILYKKNAPLQLGMPSVFFFTVVIGLLNEVIPAIIGKIYDPMKYI